MSNIFPTNATQYRIDLTGFGNPVRLNGGFSKAVIISAKQAIAGLSGGASVDNVDIVLIGFGTPPVISTDYIGQPLAPGETQVFNIADSSILYVDGASGDSVIITQLF